MELATKFVCVRVTDMRGIDLERYRFDFDLTFSALLMHPDGHVYHRFGGRDHTDAQVWISMPAMLDLMRGTLKDHAAYAKDPKPPPARPRRTVEDFPSYRRWIKGRKVECIHCHQIGEQEVLSRTADGSWDGKDIWRWPPPDRVGLVMDPKDQSRVRTVLPSSPAAVAGLKAGDRLSHVAARRVRSVNDVQFALDGLPETGATLPVRYARGDATHAAELILPDGWRRGDPLTFSWRSLKWTMRPAPGFGGRDLTRSEKKALGIAGDSYAFRVDYLVTWGRNAHVGRNAVRAGLRKGDVVVSVAGKRDFKDHDHFHSWFRLTRKKGEVVELGIIRRKLPRTLSLTVVE